MEPLVSILIPVYNAREWVAAAIDSALAQTWPRTEVIVLDDGSTDGSGEVLAGFRGRVRLESQANAGQNVSRNRLTDLSAGDWLIYLDADDELAPDAVSRRLERADTATAVYGSMEVRHYRGTDLVSSDQHPAQEFPDPLAAAFAWSYPNTSAFMFRRADLLEAGGWNEAIKNCTDYDLHFRLLLGGGKFSAAPGSHSIYRHWSSAQATHQDVLRKVSTRLDVMWGAAHQVDGANTWTADAIREFWNSAFQCIRVIRMFDRDRAGREYQRLAEWNSAIQPMPAMFSSSYRMAYRLFGFGVAERLAEATRRWKRPQGVDAP